MRLLLCIAVLNCSCLFSRAECPMMIMEHDYEDVENPHSPHPSNEDADSASSPHHRQLRTRQLSTTTRSILFNHGSNVTSTPTSAPAQHMSALMSNISQPDESMLTTNLFATAAAVVDVNATAVTTLTHCAAQTAQCGPSTTCASLGQQFASLCCSQYGWCGSNENYCGACCQNGRCWANPTKSPTRSSPVTPTRRPTRKPSNRPSSRTTTTTLATPRPSTSKPSTGRPTTRRPSSGPTRQPTEPAICTTSFTSTTYDALEADIVILKNSITETRTRTHFLGGIVRLAAHDFMDFDPNADTKMGADGCFDPTHRSNAGLSDIWGSGRPLFELHRTKYSHISKADFWVAAANAVIRQTSVSNALDMKSQFRWGRTDSATCDGSGVRLPIPSRCQQVDLVFRSRMGLSWRDAVALLGAHTLGRGDRAFSGHEGTWKVSNSAAQVFDKGYFTELLNNDWRMRNLGGPANGGPPQDFTTGSAADNITGRMMLNTDICLAYDIDAQISGVTTCCTNPSSSSGCARCNTYALCTSSQCISRREAADAVSEFKNQGNDRFYVAFSSAWNKATVLGQTNLRQLTETCS